MVKLAAFVTVVFAAMAMADPIPQASGAAVQSGREGDAMVTGTHRHHRHHRHHRTRTGSHHHGTAPAHHGHQHTKIDSAQLQAPTDSPDVPVSAPASDVNKNETSTPGSTLLGRTNNAVGGYTLHTGDGGSGWPTQSSWRSWDALVSANKPVMGKCLDGVAANSAEETDHVLSAIRSVAKSSGVDERFVLAIVMQESGGCVRVHTTNYGVRNPGLMQDHDGQGTCNEGVVQNPCPAATITQMITDGTAGTAAGEGLKQLLARAGGSGAQKFYKAARMYNSGSIAPNGKLECGIATHCYASDVANRLTGWNGAVPGCTWGMATPPGC